jgi:hypothetical protein
VIKYLDAFAAWAMPKLHAFAQFMGRDKRWQIGGVTVYLWPLTSMALFILVLLAVDALLY